MVHVLHGHFHSCILRRRSPPAVVHCRCGVEVSYDDCGPLHGQLPVRLHEMLEERVRGVAKWVVHVDDIQLPGWAH